MPVTYPHQGYRNKMAIVIPVWPVLPNQTRRRKHPDAIDEFSFATWDAPYCFPMRAAWYPTWDVSFSCVWFPL
jgi:hypothetical protein